MSNIVCIGDSLIDGSFLVTPIQMLLAHKWNSTGIVNLGVGGDGTTEIDARKADVLAYNPAIIICQFGTNDITFGEETASQITTRMASIYSYFKNTAKSEVWVFTCPPSEFELDSNGSEYEYPKRYSVRLDVNTWIRNKPTYVDKVMDAWTTLRDPAIPQKFLTAYRASGGYGPNGSTNHYNDAGLQAVVSAYLP